MRISLSILAAAIGLASPALAADKRGPAPAVKTEVAMIERGPWTGCAVEGSAARNIVINDEDIGLGSVQGTTLSLGFGCDYQVNPRFVVGAFGRYGFSLDSTKSLNNSVEIKADRPWTAAVRAGILLNEATLVYGLAGMSGLHYRLRDGVVTGSNSSKGLALGAGVETQVFSKRWTFGLEYTWSDVEGDANGHEVRTSFKHRF